MLIQRGLLCRGWSPGGSFAPFDQVAAFDGPDASVRLKMLVVRNEKGSLPANLADLIYRGQHLRADDRNLLTVTPPEVQRLTGFPVAATPVTNDPNTVVRLR
ncbi:hypothetical protein Airi02_085280 [Actinoallomurus iriomotensis]|uniref:Uncharacterized protein n=1 Tax=Actinoallomurus iriomotensis TaxID=478107 RepID=A0A9W6SBK7_9ACTN|nr:hypothetical protein Airi02_085280 [Actinoallomurus iriomotensis]